MDEWESTNRAAALASGGVEEFGEMETLYTDIKAEVDGTKNEIAKAMTERSGEAERLLAAGATVHEMEMYRHAERGQISNENDNGSRGGERKCEKGCRYERKEMASTIDAI